MGVKNLDGLKKCLEDEGVLCPDFDNADAESNRLQQALLLPANPTPETRAAPAPDKKGRKSKKPNKKKQRKNEAQKNKITSMPFPDVD